MFHTFRKTGLLLALLTFLIGTMDAQNLKGTVFDDLGDPVIGANVIEKGTTNGTITDLDGNYNLTLNDPDKAILQVSYIGYNTYEEAVNGRPTLDIHLASSVVNLGEIVAIGYGTQTRREITGSVANVSEENFNKGVTRDAADLLQGKVAGLNITSGSGDITQSSTIRLRGTSTLQNDQGPLIVIDGIPGGDMSTVPPSDIESISVLKDASSAAIYGSRAAGGVILITTKRGSGSRTQVVYDGYVAFDQMANKPDVMNADQWRNYAKSVGAETSTYDQYGADTDWFDELTRVGFSQNHAISMSGGGSKNNYRASFSYLDRNGIIRNNSLERYNFRLQFQQRAINDRLRIGITTNATISESYIPEDDEFLLAYTMLPVYPVYNADGSYFTKQNGEFDNGNPVQMQDLNERKRESIYYYGAGDIQFTIIDGLNLKANLYKSYSSSEYSEFKHSDTKTGLNTTGFAKKENTIEKRNLMEWTADYEKAFGAEEEHKLQAMAGYSWEENIYSIFHGQNSDFLINDLTYNALQSGVGLKPGDVYSNKESFKLISFFARAHYSFKERYMITATVRRDGSSKFGANHKWGTFPSASAAWGISQEDFMKDIHWINDLKIRAGYGITGNQDGLKPYKSLQLYGTQGIYYVDGAWGTGYTINQNPNPDLKWEQTAMLNIGLDFTLFNNRLNGTIEWYDKRTSDMLYSYKVPTPPYVYERMQANVGDMKNTGIEVLLNLDVIRNKEFSWNTSVNLSHNKNEITKLSNDLYTTDRIYTGSPWIRGGSNTTSHVVEVGRPVGQFFMLECLGIDESGRWIFRDLNNDGQISDDDRTYVGSAQPKVTFGWNNSFSYKAWDLSFFFRGSLGQKVFNNPRAAYGNSSQLIGTNALNDPLIYQLKEDPRISSFYLENASYVRLDNMALGYTFDTQKISWLDRARLYVAAQNLFVLTKYKGLDPEVELVRAQELNDETNKDVGLSPGIESRQFFPKARTFTIGVNLTF